jgi:hypothetical protein
MSAAQGARDTARGMGIPTSLVFRMLVVVVTRWLRENDALLLVMRSASRFVSGGVRSSTHWSFVERSIGHSSDAGYPWAVTLPSEPETMKSAAVTSHAVAVWRVRFADERQATGVNSIVRSVW